MKLFLVLPGGTGGKKNPPASAGDAKDLVSVAGSPRSPGGGIATHFSILAWRIPWTEEPDGLVRIRRLEHSIAPKHKHKFLYLYLSMILLFLSDTSFSFQCSLLKVKTTVS